MRIEQLPAAPTPPPHLHLKPAWLPLPSLHTIMGHVLEFCRQSLLTGMILCCVCLPLMSLRCIRHPNKVVRKQHCRRRSLPYRYSFPNNLYDFQCIVDEHLEHRWGQSAALWSPLLNVEERVDSSPPNHNPRRFSYILSSSSALFGFSRLSRASTAAFKSHFSRLLYYSAPSVRLGKHIASVVPPSSEGIYVICVPSASSETCLALTYSTFLLHHPNNFGQKCAKHFTHRVRQGAPLQFPGLVLSPFLRQDQGGDARGVFLYLC